jgi:hypothetical protein
VLEFSSGNTPARAVQHGDYVTVQRFRMIVERLDAAEFPIRHLVDGFEDDRLDQFPDPNRVLRRSGNTVRTDLCRYVCPTFLGSR